MRPGRRRFTVLAAVVAVAIPLTLVVMLRHRIREEWLLHCLDAAEDETRRFEILEEISALEHLSRRGLHRLVEKARNELRAGKSEPRALPYAVIRAGGAAALEAILAGDEDHVLEALSMLDWRIIEPRAVSGVVPLLKSPSFEVRVAALEAIEDAGAATEDAVTALLGLLDDYYVLIREKAESALRKSSFDSEALFRRFASLSRESDPGKRRFGVRLLQDLLSDSPDRLDALTVDSGILLLAAGLDDSDEEVRQEASWALSTQVPRIGPVVPALVRALERSTSDLDYSVLNALAALGEPVVPPLTALLRHRNPWARLAGVVALNRMEGGVPLTAVPAIVKRLSDVEPQVREAACTALGDLGPAAREAGRELREHLDDRFESIRSEAARALWRVTGDGLAAAAVLKETVLSKNENVFRGSVWTLRDIGPSARAAVPSLRKLLGDRKCSHRLWAAEAIWRILAEDAVILERLPAAISCTCSECPEAAVDICRRLGENAAAIVPACLALLEIPNTSVRTYTARCLACMGPAAESAVLALLETMKDSTFARESAREALRQIRARSKN